MSPQRTTGRLSIGAALLPINFRNLLNFMKNPLKDLYGEETIFFCILFMWRDLIKNRLTSWKLCFPSLLLVPELLQATVPDQRYILLNCWLLCLIQFIGIIRPLIRLYKPLLVNFAALVIVLPCLFILLTGYILYSAELSDRELNYCSAFWLNSSNNNNNFILCTKIQILNGLPRK